MSLPQVEIQKYTLLILKGTSLFCPCLGVAVISHLANPHLKKRRYPPWKGCFTRAAFR